ncbi:replicative DNA helicase [Feifania hominis]|uniref:Replicative DNA helicase n=1 Tax=Feifania hominis TaxID=2763660 RepID=A0A926HUS7_9FIRM|nr:replicative DNA helicase [Feifania hominis]MBC8536613.1 replicative DNA helicase [Feifania hominis]
MADNLDLFAPQLPHSMEAEQSVLGSILLDPECISEVAQAIRTEDFYLKKNADIYDVMLDMFNTATPIDAVTLIDRMKIAGVYDEAESRDYILQLVDFVPTTANVMKYAKIIEEKACLRRLIEASQEISETCYSEADELKVIVDSAEQKIFDIAQGRRTKELTPIIEVVTDAYETLNQLAGGNREDYLGVPTHFDDVDKIMGGLNKSDLIILAARPGMGKTSFAINIATNVALLSKKMVAIFSLEMSKEQLVMRMLSGEALVDSYRLRTGEIHDDEWTKLATAASALSTSPIKIDDNSAITVTEMKGKLRREKNLGLVVIDYLQLLHSGRRTENRVQEVSEITRSLKIMAKELNVPVLVLSQLSRATEGRSEKIPMLSDLRESGSVEQDADIVLFLYRDDYYTKETEQKNMAKCIIAKNRHGRTDTVDLIWNAQYTKFRTVDRVHTYEPGS